MLLRVVFSDWLKTKRTPVRLIVVAAPLLFALAILGYFSLSTQTEQMQYAIHEAFFQLGTILLPMVAGLLAGLLCAQEEQAGSFIGMLTRPVSRPTIYLGKFVLLLLMLIGIILGATGLLLAGMKLILSINAIQAALFWQSAWLAIAGALPVYVLSLFLGMAYGIGASVSAGGAGMLVAAILGTTTIGDSIWQYVPWSWPVRLAWVPVIRMQGLTLADGAIPWEIFVQHMYKGLIPAVLAFLTLIFVSLVWFTGWEGRKSYD